METRIFRVMSLAGMIAGVVAGTVSGACSVGDLSDLTTPVNDAGTRPDTSARVDGSAGSEAGTQVPTEAGTEAATPQTRFCESLPADPNRLACYDFDEARPAFDREPPAQARIEVNGDAFSSPGKSMVVTTDNVSDGYVKGVLVLQMPKILDRRGVLSIAYDIRVDQTHSSAAGASVSSNGVAVAFLQGPSANDLHQLTTGISSDSPDIYGLSFNEYLSSWPTDAGSNFITRATYKAMPELATTWTRVRMEVTINDPQGTGNLLGVFVNDAATPIYEGELTFPFRGTNPRLEFGLGNLKLPSQPWIVRYDNIVVAFVQQ